MIDAVRLQRAAVVLFISCCCKNKKIHCITNNHARIFFDQSPETDDVISWIVSNFLLVRIETKRERNTPNALRKKLVAFILVRVILPIHLFSSSSSTSQNILK